RARAHGEAVHRAGQAGHRESEHIAWLPAWQLAPLPEALALLRGPIRRRVRAACRGERLCYLENGRPVPGVGA
ncbi:MAG: hypothetical protein LBI49_26845, partial [Nocardiopsaceae bacterium]|nr:hypothetical protein [Nocardiopsaceae bacterium]